MMAYHERIAPAGLPGGCWISSNENNPENHIKNFGQGDVDKMGPALAVAMLTILYGYIIKLVTIALTKD